MFPWKNIIETKVTLSYYPFHDWQMKKEKEKCETLEPHEISSNKLKIIRPTLYLKKYIFHYPHFVCAVVTHVYMFTWRHLDSCSTNNTLIGFIDPLEKSKLEHGHTHIPFLSHKTSKYIKSTMLKPLDDPTTVGNPLQLWWPCNLNHNNMTLTLKLR